MSNPTRRNKNYKENFKFVGEHNRPLLPREIAERYPILADKRPSKEFIDFAKTYRIYVTTEKEKPEISIEKVKQYGQRTLWNIDIPQQITALNGKNIVRMNPSEIIKGIEPNVSFSGHRPGWRDLFYIPRSLPQDHAMPLKRFNGHLVKPHVVFDPDDRIVFMDPSYPWGCIGKIFTSDGKTGTAALIGKNIVVTAGHIVPWNQSPWWMKFVPAYYNGVSLHGNGVESYVSDANGYEVGDVVGYDWAILKLYNSLGSWLGYFGANGYSDSWEDLPVWTIVGYPGAVAGANRPSCQSGIAVVDDDSDSAGGLEIEHYGDTSDGNSGGPMFAWWADDPRLIGVVSGGEEEYHFPFSIEWINVIAGGRGFVDLIRWGRSNW